MATKNSILIVDDSEMNRAMLADIVSPHYDVSFAGDGLEALEKITSRKETFSLVLLDLNMPKMNGIEVLEKLSEEGILESLPVLVVSSDTDIKTIEEAYDKGALDYIFRPYNEKILLKKISNSLSIYSNKRNLEEVLENTFYETEKNNRFMIDVLANLVEFRNGETAAHILNIRSITTLLLKQLKRSAPQYNLDSEKITTIINGASLHDIGKISIPLSILNKPGRLTPEEFEVMKTHSEEGAKILQNSEGYLSSPQIRVAHEICRWHHERYDGKGYPDGLKGDEIPIGAQVVALADVYDALTAERCYKKAFSHEKAVSMIMNGECGSFNPVILSAFEKICPVLERESDKEFYDALETSELIYSARNLISGIAQASSAEMRP